MALEAVNFVIHGSINEYISWSRNLCKGAELMQVQKKQSNEFKLLPRVIKWHSINNMGSSMLNRTNGGIGNIRIPSYNHLMANRNKLNLLQ